MFQGLSLPVIVERMDISLPTAFAWRHKVPAALSRMPGPRLSGVVEADETYFRLSFKGQRGDLPRPARKRGRKSKKRGISKEKVRVLTATDRQRGTCLRSACLGRMSVDDLRRLLGDPVDRRAPSWSRTPIRPVPRWRRSAGRRTRSLRVAGGRAPSTSRR